MAIPTKLSLEIVTPDRSLVREEVDEVVLPGSEGYFGVLPGHAPLLSTLMVGELWYRAGREKRHLFVAGGFVEVLPDRVTVLAQIGERAEDIDIARAEAAKRRAEERLANPVDVDLARARFSLAKALVRIQVASFARARV
jgi:F-type H+-transporting ATPase subunit epsilon